jgi:hypothetical protein
MFSTGSELLRQPLSDVVEWFFLLARFWRVPQAFSRNELIRMRHAAGEAISALAREFGISPQRVFQIVEFRNK